MIVKAGEYDRVSEKATELNRATFGMNIATRGEWNLTEEYKYAFALYDSLYDPTLHNTSSDVCIAYAADCGYVPGGYRDKELRYKDVPLTQYCLYEARRHIATCGYTPDHQIVPCHGEWMLNTPDVWIDDRPALEAMSRAYRRDDILAQCVNMDLWLRRCIENPYLCPFARLPNSTYFGMFYRDTLICSWGLNLLGYHTAIRDVVNTRDCYTDNSVQAKLCEFWADYHVDNFFEDESHPRIKTAHVTNVVRVVKSVFQEKGAVYDVDLG